MKENKFSVSVHVAGIKKRCRKPDRHMLKLGYFDLDVDVKELENKAKELINENMKETKDEAIIRMMFVTLTEDMESFLMFDERNKDIKINLK